MNSRDYAKHLRVLAEFLDERAEFEFEYGSTTAYGKIAPSTTLSFYDKEKFVVAAKAIGNAEKEVQEGDYAQFYLVSKNVPLKLGIARDRVCKKTVKFDCEPLFSAEELALL